MVVVHGGRSISKLGIYLISSSSYFFLLLFFYVFRRKLEEKGKNTNSALCGEETHEKDMSLVDLLDPSFQYKIERQTEDKIAKRKLQASLQIQAKMIMNCKKHFAFIFNSNKH